MSPNLYVRKIGEDYFVARAREGSDDVAFTWMLTAPGQATTKRELAHEIGFLDSHNSSSASRSRNCWTLNTATSCASI